MPRPTSIPACAGVLLLLGATVVAAPAAAPPAPAKSSLVFVLDGSGSMWGRIQGDRMKIVAAKQVTRELLQEVPETVSLGFVAYGHRRKGDCSDIETLAPLGTEPSQIADAVERIVPRGKTPITESLRHAARMLGSQEGESTLVLVSDGIETCGGDPCALAEELRAGGVRLVIHTVGFGVDEEAARQLRCVAEAGGGNYYPATDAAGLRDALFAVREAVARREPPPPPPPLPATDTTSTTARKIGPATLVLDPAPWVELPVESWKVVDVETGEERGKTNDDTLRVRAGEYQIVWRQSQHGHGDAALTEVVKAEAGQTLHVPITTGVRPLLPEGFPTPYRWWLRVPGEEDAVAARYQRVDGPQVAPAGRYELVWWQDQHGSRPVDLGVVDVAPGRLNDIPLGGIRVAAAEWVPGDPEQYRLVDADGNEVGRWETFGPQLAPPGTYRLEYQQTQHGHSLCPWGSITVPEQEFATVPINSGVRFVVSEGTELPYRIFFVNLDLGAECVWKGPPYNDEWQPIALPPGRYRLDWWDEQRKGERMTLVDEFEIPKGTLIEFEM